MNTYKITLSDDQLAVLAEMGYTDPNTAAQDFLDEKMKAGVEELNAIRDKSLVAIIKSDPALIAQIVQDKNLDPVTFVSLDAAAVAVDPNAQGV